MPPDMYAVPFLVDIEAALGLEALGAHPGPGGVGNIELKLHFLD